MTTRVDLPSRSIGGMTSDVLDYLRTADLTADAVVLVSSFAAVRVSQMTDAHRAIMPMVCDDGATFAPDSRKASGRGAILGGGDDRSAVTLVINRAMRARLGG